ncbi:MAG TPA: DUF4926 domain-containing protein [Longimicrobiales bacterium]|nr:DUF4926 domain-containing protein [Longimicrobiales bacterium]
MFSELELVVLTRDHPDAGLRAGDVGTVVAVRSGGRGRYEVEFSSPGGVGAGVLRLPASHLRPVARHEIFHVRSLGSVATA